MPEIHPQTLELGQECRRQVDDLLRTSAHEANHDMSVICTAGLCKFP